MKIENEILAVAALLKNIGKFIHRAREREDKPIGQLSREFVENTLPLPREMDSKRVILADFVGSGEGKGIGESVLYQAAMLASGVEGEKPDDEDQGHRLPSSFEGISLKGTREGHKKGNFYYSLEPIEKNAFPCSLEEARQSDYASLYKKFLNAIEKVDVAKGFPHYISSLQSILENFTWSIPYSTVEKESKVSLYDHALATAAIAQAMVAYDGEREQREEGRKFFLLGGDLSGIQKYIFDIDKSHGRGVAKLFRARSLYLQALTRSALLSLLNRLELLPTALIMDAGGRFILLLPATEEVRKTVSRFEEEGQKDFLENFKGELAINLALSREIGEEGLSKGKIHGEIDALNDKLERVKCKKFGTLLEKGISPILDLRYNEFEEGNCKVCHKEAVHKESSEHYRKKYEKEILICQNCHSQIEKIGTRLPNKEYRYLVFYSEEGIKGERIPLLGGLYMELVKEIREEETAALQIVNIRDRKSFAYQPMAGHLPMINGDDINRWRDEGLLQKDEKGRDIYLDETVTAGQPKTFNILAGESRHTQKNPKGEWEVRGSALLGALKADLDNLGFLFSVGLDKGGSLARYSGLSRMLNHFFSDHLVDLIEKHNRDIYVVFSGGDDLFLLGPWKKMISFAHLIQREFFRFTGRNREITLSAGIAMAKAGIPMRTITAEAEEFLERSKRRKEGKKVVKNGVTLFNTTLAWEELGRLIEKGEELERLVRGNKVTLGLVRRLLGYGEDYIAFHERGEIKRGVFMSHMAYDFARNIKKEGENSLSREEEAQLMEVRTELYIKKIRVPVSWVLYSLRSNG